MTKYKSVKTDVLFTKQLGLAVRPREENRISDILTELSEGFLILTVKG